MNKRLLLLLTILGMFILGGCAKQSKQTVKNSISSTSKIEKTSSSNISSNSSETQTEATTTTAETNSKFLGYSDEQIEYARVTEQLVNYYKITIQPVSINVTRNGVNHSVFPYAGSVTVPQETFTLSFSTDNTMAGTIIVTYSSNHNGSINFYKNPNHYHDERYMTDPAWVTQESQKLLDSTETLEISTSFDDEAAKIISIIQIQ